MAVISTNVKGAGASDDDNPDLPLPVRQLLHQSGSEYEQSISALAELRWRYYHNTAYDKEWLRPSTVSAVTGGQEIQGKKELYSSIKALQQLATNCVDRDVETVYAGAQLTPAVRNEALQARCNRLWEAGELSLMADRGVQFGAVTGHHYKRVIPGWLEERGESAPSRVEVYSPEICTVLKDPHNAHNLLAAKIEYVYPEQGSDADRVLLAQAGAGSLVSPNSPLYLEGLAMRSSGAWSEAWHTYTLIITEDSYYTFRDHLLFPYPGNPGGRNSWGNPLQVVPIVDVPFIDVATDMGLPTFHHILPTLDAINELLSLMGNVIQNNGGPILVAYNINPQSIITRQTTADGTTVWYVPPAPNFGLLTAPSQPKLEYLTMDASGMAGMVGFIDYVHKDLRRAIPETVLDQDSPASTVSSGYQGTLLYQALIGKLGKVRKGDFLATERAAQMAFVSDDIKRGARRGPRGRELLETAKERYDLVIQANPILPIDKEAEAQAQATDMSNNLLSHKRVLILRGYTEQKADEILQQVSDEKLEAARVEAEQSVILASAQQRIMQMQMVAETAQMEAQVAALERVATLMGGSRADPSTILAAFAAATGKTPPTSLTSPPGAPGGGAGGGAKKPPVTTTGKGPTRPSPSRPQNGNGALTSTSARSAVQPNRARVGPRLRRANPGRKS